MVATVNPLNARLVQAERQAKRSNYILIGGSIVFLALVVAESMISKTSGTGSVAIPVIIALGLYHSWLLHRRDDLRALRAAFPADEPPVDD